jgi:lactate dehydrogenase-like 2-hydroxyacid dehydrogenase
MGKPMKPKVLVTREVFDETLELLGQHFEVTSNQSDQPLSSAELAARLADKAGALTVLTDRINEPLLAQCPHLKAVCNIAVGFNNFDLKAMSARGVMGTNTPGVLDAATADFTWALILATARRLTEAESWLRAGQWHGWKLKQFLGMDVQGATLGVIGMGRIGQAVARRARGFDMPVLYYNRKRLDPALERECNARHASLDELLAQSDFVTLHTPYSAESHHLIGATQLAKMKKSAILIHAARGGVVDDVALIAALKNGTIAAAGMDVYENEPKFNPDFLKLSNVVLAPHIASATNHTRRNMAMLAATNLVAALTGKPPPNLLNPDVLKPR